MTKKNNTLQSINVSLDCEHYINEDLRSDLEKSDWTSTRPNDSYELRNVRVTLSDGKWANTTYTQKDLGFTPKIGDEVFIIIQDYSTGDTFSYTEHMFRSHYVTRTSIAADEWLQKYGFEREICSYFDEHNGWIVKKAIVED